ncbi:MAG TPA: transaldolase [Bacteroidota bacterium]|nr:transaldolase [Bacteroidota bacterium]
MNNNPLRTLESYGQSIWIDFISSRLIENGGLQKFIDEDGVSGVTSNPSIFEKAIAESHDYDDRIRHLATQGKSAEEVYETLTVEDIQHTADILRPTFERLKGADGFVSLEVSPKLANDTPGTMEEARRLWKKVNRTNVMIKVPGTAAGIPAIRQLTSDGVSVNVTLLFGLPRYREVAEAYIAGLEERAARREPLKGISSVASFFLSRIDSMVDPMLDSAGRDGAAGGVPALALKGKVAVASAKLAHRMYGELFAGPRFRKLLGFGATPQRLLWASTSTKNPEYSDVKYVEPLIGKDTINTVPLETLDAYRDHGKPGPTLTRGLQEAQQDLEHLERVGINLDDSTRRLEMEGVGKFIKAYDQLLNAIRQKASTVAARGAA